MKIYFAVIGLMLNFALVAGPLDESKIKNIINSVEFGWENGDGTPFKEHFFDFQILQQLHLTLMILFQLFLNCL